MRIELQIPDEWKRAAAQRELEAYPASEAGCLMAFLGELAREYDGKVVVVDE